MIPFWDIIGLLSTNLDSLAGGEGLAGYVVLVEHHVNAGGGYENGQVHFDRLAQRHFAPAAPTASADGCAMRAEIDVVALHPGSRMPRCLELLFLLLCCCCTCNFCAAEDFYRVF